MRYKRKRVFAMRVWVRIGSHSLSLSSFVLHACVLSETICWVVRMVYAEKFYNMHILPCFWARVFVYMLSEMLCRQRVHWNTCSLTENAFRRTTWPVTFHYSESGLFVCLQFDARGNRIGTFFIFIVGQVVTHISEERNWD